MNFLLTKQSVVLAGMSAGIPKFVTVNLQQLNKAYEDGETVDLNTLQQKRLLNLSGREAKLPLKVCLLVTMQWPVGVPQNIQDLATVFSSPVYP